MSGSGPPSQNVSRETSSEPAPPVVPPRVLTSLDAEIGGDTWLLPELEPRYNKLRTDEQRTFRRLGLHHHLQKYGLDLIDWIRDTNGNEEPPEQFFRNLCMDPLEPPESTSNGTVYQCGKKSCGKVDTFQHLRSHWRAKSHLGIAFFRCHIWYAGFSWFHIHLQAQHDYL
ncbi:hypothetical protein CPB86DRAFT_791455 [Serendipita vermifera]|nr:hypothetical protein CPB86DRAFT_791455 [Serendipita vermifera]